MRWGYESEFDNDVGMEFWYLSGGVREPLTKEEALKSILIDQFMTHEEWVDLLEYKKVKK